MQSLLDSIVVSTLNEHDKLNFGKLRLWGELGNGVASSLMMYIVNKTERGFDVSRHWNNNAIHHL